MRIYILTILLAILSPTRSHSWVERLMVIADNGTMVGKPGYIRGTISRLDPTFNDFQMQHLLSTSPEKRDRDNICKSTQTFRNYSAEFPALKAPPGGFVALQYQENGHVTLPELTPEKRSSGFVYIYGTSNPLDNDTLSSIHGVWNEQGTGGDGRGILLAVREFDDGRCYQINDGHISKERQMLYHKIAMDPQGADLWCQNDVELPYNISSSWFTLYWVWDWPSSPSTVLPEGKQEIYTSCLDIQVIEGLQLHFLEYIDGQDLNSASIKHQLEK
ncbi:hypothetical protein MAA_06112 [Metarhizium robertsii ARSEF 23]|uniref:DUF7492 domain-containing protein n=1 Tax=Metarhizium robertsii (strain ARSEF 23 / ATCC MYA-3075) TaxID=655844 RepID=E9F1R4_METRA|nr:uncharacterized protein MAA_06112 [Metarhizium robertsii ARSEF 23]EFY98003.1 hypothetical protein MAA_06112 [Metarhizium robertsii ARSEF 23]